MAGTETIRAGLWTRAEIHGLEITGDLFDRSHDFQHDGLSVSVRLPQITVGDDLKPTNDRKGIVALRSWLENATPATTHYALAEVIVVVEVSETLTVPTEIFNHHPKQPGIAGPTLTEQLDATVDEYKLIAAGAIARWESVVRWITGSSSLGSSGIAPTLSAASRMQFTALVRMEDEKRFWLPAGMFSIPSSTLINAPAWEAIGGALAQGQELPIWFRYLQEADHRYAAGDLTGTILSCAIACETVTREAFWLASGATTNDKARALLDRVSVTGILKQWGSITGTKRQPVHARIGEIFTLRNRVMHFGGRGGRVDGATVKTLLADATTFIRSADDWIFEALKEPNPRKFEA